MLFLESGKGKLNFIVAIHVGYDVALTGGVMAMHTLAYELAIRGHNVYILTQPAKPHENIKVINYQHNEPTKSLELGSWEPFVFDYNNTVTIYPQIARGNPIGTSNVCRWLLYDSDYETEQTYGQDDVIFNYNDFKSQNNSLQKLTVVEYNQDKLYRTNFGKRKGFCHINNKNVPAHGYEFLSRISDCDLSNWRQMGCFDYLREKFNEYEYLLTYDRKSFFPLAAGMCGCKTIILEPDQTISAEEYRDENPLSKYGVAYGWDDIQWANNTINLIEEHVNLLRDSDSKTIDDFVAYWLNKLNI